jgi:signal transduction histidine kinase
VTPSVTRSPRSAWSGLISRRLRLRTLLVLLGLLIFGLPLAGLAFLRVYDNQLVRHTEGELVAQGAVVVAAYRQALEARLVGQRLQAPPGSPLDLRWKHLHEPGFTPVPARLNLLAEQLRPPADEARAPAVPAAPEAVAAGREIEALLRHAQRVTLAGIRVVDHQGVVVATTREEGAQSLRHREEVARALAGENVSLLRARVSDDTAPPLSSLSRETGVRVLVVLPVVSGTQVLGAVVLARTPQSLGKAFYEDRLYLTGTALVLLVVVLAVTLLMAAFLVRPLGALTRQAEEVAAGRPAPPPLRHAGTREVARLSESFSRMARALEERADYIRSFAAAVSHEFKTPLAALQGTIELLREHDETMPTAERARFLGNASEDIGRLDRLVRRLLELARADVVQPAQSAHPVAPTITAVVASRQAQGRSIAPSVAAGLEVRMAPDVLETILENLIENAYQHGGPEARVSVGARPAGSGGGGAGQVIISVANDGRPLSPANAERAFEPFFTTARDRGGTGLGLTIVRALVRAHGGSVELTAGDDGTTATVRLPGG